MATQSLSISSFSTPVNTMNTPLPLSTSNTAATISVDDSSTTASPPSDKQQVAPAVIVALVCGTVVIGVLISVTLRLLRRRWQKDEAGECGGDVGKVVEMDLRLQGMEMKISNGLGDTGVINVGSGDDVMHHHYEDCREVASTMRNGRLGVRTKPATTVSFPATMDGNRDGARGKSAIITRPIPPYLRRINHLDASTAASLAPGQSYARSVSSKAETKATEVWNVPYESIRIIPYSIPITSVTTAPTQQHPRACKRSSSGTNSYSNLKDPPHRPLIPAHDASTTHSHPYATPVLLPTTPRPTPRVGGGARSIEDGTRAMAIHTATAAVSVTNPSPATCHPRSTADEAIRTATWEATMAREAKQGNTTNRHNDNAARMHEPTTTHYHNFIKNQRNVRESAYSLRGILAATGSTPAMFPCPTANGRTHAHGGGDGHGHGGGGSSGGNIGSTTTHVTEVPLPHGGVRKKKTKSLASSADSILELYYLHGY